jgi:hypothetical protein
MRRLIFLLLSILLGFVGCNKFCDGCGPVGYANYFIQNRSVDNLKLIFFGDSTTNFNMDSIIVPPNERVGFLYVSTGAPLQSNLKFRYYLCDSILIYELDSFKARIIDINDCSVLYNPICTSNYILTKTDEVKKGKNKRDRHSIYELLLP